MTKTRGSDSNGLLLENLQKYRQDIVEHVKPSDILSSFGGILSQCEYHITCLIRWLNGTL